MSVDISIDFGRRLGGATLADFGRLRGDVGDVLEDLLLSFQEELQAVWPVDTGTSLTGWDTYEDGLRLVLRNAVEYAVYVHVAGDPQPVWEYLRAFVEERAAGTLADLRGLLARARAEEGAQASLFGGRAVRRPSAASIVGGAVFRALARSFERPGRGARQRLRERFPNQPIGRAASRQRDRSRLR